MTDDTPTPATAAPASPKGPATTVTAGTLIMGTYEIEKLINRGGMGEVYRGRNIHNDEPVAIKIVLPSLAHDQKIVALFQKESTVLSRLSHEAIVRYHVFTNDPTIGRPCMVMEFVSGLPLADRIEQGPMPVSEVKVMLRRIASGLDKAHRAGVVHRDLSPDNVILEEGSFEHAKLIDFGIAKSTSFGSGTLLGGQFAGKFNWVSPEQLGAYGGVVDGRSDVYSLALITAAASRGAVLQMGASIVDAVGKRATVPALDGVDPELVPLLDWMLQPDPEQRCESMAKVMAALDNPGLIPQAEAPAPAAPDPNRTVIEPLPVMPAAPAAPVAPAVTAAPAGDWSLPAAPAAPTAPPPPRQQTEAPDGATVIAPHPVVTAAPLARPAEEEESPFGAPAAKVAPAARPDPAPTPVAPKNGKGGLITVLILLAVLGGGAGAWFGGLIGGPATDPGKAEATDPAKTPTATDTPTQTEPKTDPQADAKTAEDEAAAKAEAEAKAAAEANAKAEADALAKAEADAKAKADQEAKAKADADAAAAAEAAAKTAAEDARAKAEAASAAQGIAENARDEAAKLAAGLEGATDAAAAQTAAEDAARAVERAEAGAKAADEAVNAIEAAAATAKGQPGPEAEVAKALDAARAAAAAATVAAKAAADSAAGAATAAKALADAAAAKAAEDKAKADELAADPVARQQAHFDGLTLPACSHLSLVSASDKGFALSGYAVEAAPLETLAADWEKATGLVPQIEPRLVNEAQCAVLDFLTAQRGLETLTVSLDGGTTLKSGSEVAGTIKGVAGRPYTVFFVNGSGGATNVNKWTAAGQGGDVTFRFPVRLKPGAPPSPQLLLVVIGDQGLASALEKVIANVVSRQLVEFIGKRMAAGEGDAALGLGFFRLEN